jgi:hypothetical protein
MDKSLLIPNTIGRSVTSLIVEPVVAGTGFTSNPPAGTAIGTGVAVTGVAVTGVAVTGVAVAVRGATGLGLGLNKFPNIV